MEVDKRAVSASCDSDTMPSDTCSWEDMLLRLVEQEEEAANKTLAVGKDSIPDLQVGTITSSSAAKGPNSDRSEQKANAPHKDVGFKPSMFSSKPLASTRPSPRAAPLAEVTPPAIVPIVLKASDDSVLMSTWKAPSLPIAMYPVACASIVMSLPLTVGTSKGHDTFSDFLRSMHNMSFSRPIGSFTVLTAGERYTGVTVPPHMDSTPFKSYNSVSVVGTFDPNSATLTRHFAEDRVIGVGIGSLCVSVKVQCKIQDLFEALLKSKLTHSFMSVVGGANLSNCATHIDLELQSDPIHPDSINHMGDDLDSLLGKSLGVKRDVAITVVPKHVLHLLGGTDKDIQMPEGPDSPESEDYYSDDDRDNGEDMWGAVSESRTSNPHMILMQNEATHNSMEED
jgi:hypothetical protein